jgi:hypothetical protein
VGSRELSAHVIDYAGHATVIIALTTRAVMIVNNKKSASGMLRKLFIAQEKAIPP